MKFFIIFYICMGLLCSVVLYITAYGVIKKLGFETEENEKNIPIFGLILPCVFWPLMALVSISQLLEIITLWGLKSDDDIDKDERDKIEQEMNKTIEKALWNSANKASGK